MKDTVQQAISHFKYGISHDIFSEPVTTYAKLAVEALEQKWIPVTERLPEAFVSVLVHMPEERPLPTVHEGYVTNQGTWYAHFFEREPFEVTHWMPLPSTEGLE